MGERGGDGGFTRQEGSISSAADSGLKEMLKPPPELKAIAEGSSQNAISPPEIAQLFLSQPQPDSLKGGCQYVSFSLCGLRLAASIENVAYVGSMPPITPLPNVPKWVKGVVNLRGEILPALSLATFLGKEEPVNPPTGMLVIKASGGEAAAVLVADEVRRIVRPKATLAGNVSSFICGSFTDEEGECQIVDVEKLLASPEFARYR
ncbi:MAG: chemotaxis protein CheW [Candidatus Caldarchaeum sp.]